MMAIFKSKLPTLPEVSPELAAAIQVRNRILTELRDTKVKTADLRASISQGMTSDGQDSRVAAILAGQKTAEPEGDLQRLGELVRRIEDLNAAGEAQATAIRDLERRASAKLCDSVRAEHDKLAAAICTKLLELHTLQSTYTDLLDAITDQGASTTSLPILQSSMLEHPKYRDSAVAYLFRDAAKLGHMAASKVPEALR
jgi:hypothetical protein